MSKKTDYKILAETILKEFDFDTVLDVGCGEGYLLHHFKKAGKKVHGVDIQQTIWCPKNEIVNNIEIRDTNKPFTHPADLVICLEVAEHSPTPLAIIKNVINNAKKYIIFSGAQLMQPGIGHISCLPYPIWLSYFLGCSNKIKYNLTKTIELINKLNGKFDTCWWLLNNLMIFDMSK